MSIAKTYTYSQRAVGGLVAMIIGIAFISYFMGATLSSTTMTIASTTTTQLEVTTYTSSTVSSFTVESYVIQTTTEFQTVTQMGPDSVLLSGTVATKTIGTSPKVISFVSASNNQTSNAQVQDGRYSITLPNRDSFNAYIEFGTVTGDVGAGKCVAGGLILFTQSDSLVANWSC